MRIIITTIPHKDQRYPTVGDYQYGSDGSLNITVSKMGDRRHEMLVAIHELCEAFLCEQNVVPVHEIDSFDIAFETGRKDGDLSEPGDSPDAPYRAEHSIATGIERILAGAGGIDWQTYEEAVNGL